MNLELRWTTRAREDLLEIYLAIAIENKRAAQSVISTLEARAASLSEHPRLGPRRDDIRLGMRMLVERPYLVFYRLMPDGDNKPVERADIVRVIDGRRDLRRLL